MSSVQKIVLGHIINPISDKKAQFVFDGAMVLKEFKSKAGNGFKISEIGSAKKILKNIDAKNGDVQILDFSGQLIIPPFFDMHFHWVQDAVRTMPKDNLLNWLDKYTFPAEAKFKNKSYAKKEAQAFFKRLIATGTLGGACYSSIHEHALEYAMDEVKGDFVIGNVLMTINSPKALTQKLDDVLGIVKRLSEKYKKRYALTPRFAIATDPETMLKSGKIAKKSGSFIQTHLSETLNEIDFVKSIYKNYKGFEKINTYTDIYKKVGMLGPKTIMGHGIYLSKDELDTIAKTKTSIAHCPTSNAPKKQLGLGSGLFDFKITEKKGIRWALGSDIGGGPFLSMLDVMRSFVAQNEKAGVQGATYTKALYRATVAGAEILNLTKSKGNFEKGKDASFVVFDKVKIEKSDNAEIVLQKLIKKCAKNRAGYDDMANYVFQKGSLLYSKES